MQDNVIYFPYTHVPYKSQWFNQVALYWDNIYSINPRGKSFRPYMQKLIDYDLVKPINVPDDIETDINDDEFLDFIEKQEYPSLQNSNPFNWDKSVKLFHEKFDRNESIANALIERGLARKQYDYYKVEQKTANLYMLFLAREIGKDKDYKATPITNTQKQLSYSDPLTYFKEKQIINKKRYTILDDIFPGPCGKEVNIESIYKFKKDNFELLNNFREYIEKEIEKIVNIKNPERKKDREERFKIESECYIKEISQKMDANKWKNIIRNNWWMFGLHTSILGVSLATEGLGHSGLYHSILLACESIKVTYDKFKDDKKIREHPLAYAVITSKNFKVKNCI